MNSKQLIQPRVGDVLSLWIAQDKTIHTKIERIEGEVVWVDDFLFEIRKFNWRHRAYDAVYTTDKRSFSFLVEIEGREQMENIHVVRLTRISTIQEVQRRASFRLPYTFDVMLRTLDTDEPYVQCKGIDISETGLGLTSKHKWDPGSMLECKFEIQGESYTFHAKVMRKVMRVEEMKDNKGDLYIYKLGIQFVDENERLLRNIRRFIYKKQIEQKK